MLGKVICLVIFRVDPGCEEPQGGILSVAHAVASLSRFNRRLIRSPLVVSYGEPACVSGLREPCGGLRYYLTRYRSHFREFDLCSVKGGRQTPCEHAKSPGTAWAFVCGPVAWPARDGIGQGRVMPRVVSADRHRWRGAVVSRVAYMRPLRPGRRSVTIHSSATTTFSS